MKTVNSFYRLTENEQRQLCENKPKKRRHIVRNTVFVCLGTVVCLGVYVAGTALPYRTVEAQTYTDKKTGQKLGTYSGYVNYFGGEPVGEGTVTLSDGSVFSAYITNLFGKISYKDSSCEFTNGSRFVGEVGSLLYPNGQGTFFAVDGTERTGVWTWKTDYEVDSDNTYTGMVNSDGERDGYGKVTYATGGVYDGQWIDGKRDGYGTYTFANGDVYSGQWKSGKYNGIGTFTSANGWFYEGEWSDGQMDGKGKVTLSDGKAYNGEWIYNEEDGERTFIADDGYVIHGEYIGENP